MRILKQFANHKLAVLAVVILLALQALCDLSLPTFTATIVNVGIQQSGIENAVPTEISENTQHTIEIMLSEENSEVFKSSYSQNEAGSFSLNETGQKNVSSLNDIMALPMVLIYKGVQLANFDATAVRNGFDAGTLSKADVQAMLNDAHGVLGEDANSLISQQAISAVAQEYESLGINVADIQLAYLGQTGFKMLGVCALGVLVAILLGFVASVTGAKIGRDLRKRLFDTVVRFSNAQVQEFGMASLITRGTNDVQQVQTTAVMLLRMVLYAPILAVGGIIMMVQTDVSMGWIVILAVLAVGAILVVLMKVAVPKFRIMQKLIDRVNLISRETLTGLSVIRAFGREKFEEQRFDEASLRLMKTQLFTNRVMTFMMPTMMLIMNVVSVAIIWFGGQAVDSGQLQTGSLIAFITYAMVIIMGFLMLGMIFIMLPRANVAACRIEEVLNTKPLIQNPTSGEDRSNAFVKNNSSTGAKVEFKDVSFKYAENAKCVLEHVSFTAQPGKTTAIIGSTGCGKSTVLKLVERFFDVSEGSIEVDGVDVRNIDQKTLRSQFGYVPQAAFLFTGTIEGNIAYGMDEENDDAVSVAADVAQASSFISQMPQGMKTEVSQGGSNVSGGQRQRLAIARALAFGARAFLFDDSFSALDYKTDAALRHELKQKLGGKTVIIVAQRISTVLDADQIIVLDNGKVTGIGTHSQLLKTCKDYREIARLQLSESELEGGVLA